MGMKQIMTRTLYDVELVKGSEGYRLVEGELPLETGEERTGCHPIGVGYIEKDGEGGFFGFY